MLAAVAPLEIILPTPKLEPDPDLVVPSIVAMRDVVRGYGPAKSFFGPWLSDQVEEKPLRALFLSLDPVVLLLNVAGWQVSELVIGQDEKLLDAVITVRVRDGWVDELAGERAWWNEAGADHPGTPWACALRLLARKTFGPNVVLGDGIAIEPSHPAFHSPVDDDEAEYFDRLLILSDPGATDFTSFVVASHEQLFGTSGVRAALIDDILAVCHARATDSSVPSGLLGMYSPQYWWVPAQMDADTATRAAMTEEFAELGWALVDAELGDLGKFEAFLDEETRAPDLLKALGRRSLLERAKGLISEGAAPEELLAHLEQWLAAVEAYAKGVRISIGNARAMTYTQALFVAQTVGALDFLGTIGMEGARLDPAHAGGLYINAPKTRSAQAAKIRYQCFEAWMWWEADHARSLAVLAELRDALDVVEKNVWVEVVLEQDRLWITLDPGKVDNARLLLRDAIDRVDTLIATPDASEDLFRLTLDTVGYALTVADPFWLEDWEQFGQDTWAGAARDFVDAFINGFVTIVEPELPDLAESARASLGNAMLGSLLQPVFLVGVVYGAGESINSAIENLLPWIDNPRAQIQQIIDGLSALLAQEEETVGDALGQAAGEGALDLADRLLAQPDPWHYAFEAGRIAGPLILNVVLELIFEAYVTARLAEFGMRALRRVLDGLDEFVQMRAAARALARYNPPFGWHDGIYATVESGDVAVGAGDLVTVSWNDHPDVWLTQKLTPETRLHLVNLDVESKTRNVVLGTLGESERGAPLAGSLEAVLESPGTRSVHADLVDHIAADPATVDLVAAADMTDPPLAAEDLPRFDANAPEQFDAKVAESVADGSTVPPSDELGFETSSPGTFAQADEMWELNKASIISDRLRRFGINAWNSAKGVFNPVSGPHGTTRVEGWLTPVKMLRDRAAAKGVRDVATAIDDTLTYHAAHLIPRTMGGPGDAWNLIATDPRINMSYIKITENEFGRILDSGRDVYVTIDVDYASDGLANAVRYRVFGKNAQGVPEELDYAVIVCNPRAGAPTDWLAQRRAERWLYLEPEA
jgi:hypothetical protein